MVNVERAAAQLYEDPSLTDELTDAPAGKLLDWGARQVEALAQRYGDDEARFEDGVAALNRLVKTVNRFTWKRLDMDSTAQAEYVGRVVDAARQAGLDVPGERIEQYLQQHHSLDEEQNVQAMIAMVEPPQPRQEDTPLPPRHQPTRQEDTPRSDSSPASPRQTSSESTPLFSTHRSAPDVHANDSPAPPHKTPDETA